MTAQMQVASSAADPHTAILGKSGRAENPCKQGMVCQTSSASPVLSETSVSILLTDNGADVYTPNAEGGPSQPPDVTLRPPRQL